MDVLALFGWRTCRETPFKNSFSSASLPTRRSRAAMRASYSASTSAGRRVAVEPTGLELGDPDLNQIAADPVSSGEGVQCLPTQKFLDDLALELDRMRAVLGHGLSPRKPGSVSRFSPSPSVHPKGCTPLRPASGVQMHPISDAPGGVQMHPISRITTMIAPSDAVRFLPSRATSDHRMSLETTDPDGDDIEPPTITIA